MRSNRPDDAFNTQRTLHKFHAPGFRQSVACLILVLSGFFADITRADPVLIEERESIYNNIYIYRNGPLISMTFGHNTRYYTESVYDTTNALALPVIYTRYMTVSLAYVPDASNILEIGFGGGRTAWYLHSLLPSSMITSVELDPEVVALAKKHFAITPSGNFSVEVADGRKFLQSSGGCWNVILVDAYRGPFVPFHLLTREFFELVKSRLCTGGVAVQNVEPTTMMFDSALATIKTVFKNADAYNARGNIVVVAYDGELRSQSDLTARAETVQGKYKLVYPLTEMIPERRVVREIRDAKVLTDDFAPVESLLAIEQHNRKLGDFSEAPPK